MTLDRPRDFDIAALYTALDAERRSRGMSWQQLACEARWISVSTLTGMRERGSLEGDGVLQLLAWLQRTPESFVPGEAGRLREPADLPEVEPHRILRFDTGAIYQALDAKRAERGMTWKQVAAEIGGLNAASLTRLSKGGRTSFPKVMRIFGWLRRPAASFTRISDA